MKLLLVGFLLSLNMFSASDNTLLSLRKLYYDSSESSSSASKFLQLTKSIDSNSDPILLCYKGMAFMLQAKHSFNPYKKLAHFNTGKTWLEGAIKRDPENVEIRFMRFCIQTNSPFFLDYSKDTTVDKNIILKNWELINDFDLKSRIREYMAQSSYCNANEIALLK